MLQLIAARAAARGVVGIVVLLGSAVSVATASAETGAGALDPKFSRDGKTTVNFRNDGAGRNNYYFEDASDVAIRSRGKVITAGPLYHRGKRKDGVGVARLKKNGAPDRRFGGDGLVRTRFRHVPDEVRLAFPGHGRVVLAGAANGHLVVARYRSNGSLARGFSGNGKVSTAIDNLGSDTVDVTVDGSGRTVVAGGAGSRAVIVRYTRDGHRDPSFGTNGVVVTDGLGGAVSTVELQPDGTLIVVTTPNFDAWHVWRVSLDGTIDPGFVSETLTDYEEVEAHAIEVQGDGKILVAGNAWYGDGDNADALVVRYNLDGTSDTSFGGGDGYIVKGQRIWSHAYAMALQPDGKILFAGDTQGENGGGPMRLYRVNPNGNTDRSFSRDGVTGGQTPNPARAIAVRGRRVVVVGDAWLRPPAGYAFGLARYGL